MMLMATTASAQENLQRGAIASQVKKTFTTVKELPITSVKNQYRSGTCWAYATLGYFESEILRQTGKTYDLCEMFVVNNDYMDNATHYVRMHGYSQISEGGSCDDVLDKAIDAGYTVAWGGDVARDFIALNTTYLFLNQHALPSDLKSRVSLGAF